MFTLLAKRKGLTDATKVEVLYDRADLGTTQCFSLSEWSFLKDQVGVFSQFSESIRYEDT